jgi:hypothetical protein
MKNTPCSISHLIILDYCISIAQKRVTNPNALSKPIVVFEIKYHLLSKETFCMTNVCRCVLINIYAIKVCNCLISCADR